MLNQNNDNYNSQSKQMKISLVANENSKSEQVNSLKRGKKRVTKPQVEHIWLAKKVARSFSTNHEAVKNSTITFHN